VQKLQEKQELCHEKAFAGRKDRGAADSDADGDDHGKTP